MTYTPSKLFEFLKVHGHYLNDALYTLYNLYLSAVAERLQINLFLIISDNLCHITEY